MRALSERFHDHARHAGPGHPHDVRRQQVLGHQDAAFGHRLEPGPLLPAEPEGCPSLPRLRISELRAKFAAVDTGLRLRAAEVRTAIYRTARCGVQAADGG